MNTYPQSLTHIAPRHGTTPTVLDRTRSAGTAAEPTESRPVGGVRLARPSVIGQRCQQIRRVGGCGGWWLGLSRHPRPLEKGWGGGGGYSASLLSREPKAVEGLTMQHLKCLKETILKHTYFLKSRFRSRSGERSHVMWVLWYLPTCFLG